MAGRPGACQGVLKRPTGGLARQPLPYERGAAYRPPTSPPMRPLLATVLLLSAPNVFMTFAWYAHLRHLSARPWVVAALISWGIAFFEYLLQVPANRIGYTELSLGQLKILQEVIALSVFAPVAIYYMKAPLDLDYLWAALCIAAAAYFIFRA